MMSRTEVERNRARRIRERELELLRRIVTRRTREYAERAAGYWLQLWQGKRSVLKGRARKVA